MDKKTVVVIFGGQSSEHEVSCVSATTIIENMNKDKYDIIPLGITKEGKWLVYNGEIDNMTNGTWEKEAVPAVISPDATEKSLLIINEKKVCKKPIDIVFPALHGLYGEDGSIQGLFELAKIPYVGCGILASSVSMDKLYTKIIVDSLGIRQADYLGIYRAELENMNKVVEEVEDKFTYPVFIKPSNAGSSMGVSKAHDREELSNGLLLAAKHDRKIMVEEFIDGREIECAVLGNEQVKASGVGEILAAAEFYDYDAKYNNSESKTVINPDLPEEVIEEVREVARQVFRAVDGNGLSRVDFFVEKDSNKVIFNEINTLPGFTAISMYPMLWENQGLKKVELIDELINLAIERS